jgi:hypothetical protein
MQHGGQARRNQRMHHAQRPGFHQLGRNLRRSDESGGDRGGRAGATFSS